MVFTTLRDLQPPPVTMEARRPPWVIRVTLTTSQSEAAKEEWEKRAPTERKAIAERAGYSSQGSSRQVAQKAWDGQGRQAQVKLAAVLVPHLFSSAEIEAAKAAPETARAIPEPSTPVIPVIPEGSTPTSAWGENSKLIPESAPVYIPQSIVGTTDLEILSKAVGARQNILLLGATGLGKTTALRVVAFNLRMPYLSVNLNGGTTAEDFVGAWRPREEGGGFGWIDGVLTQFIRFGGLLVAEEINAASPEILFALHPVLDDTRALLLTAKGDKGALRAHPGFVFAATMNPATDQRYAGTQLLNIALQDRFQCVVEFTGQNVSKIILDAALVAVYQRLEPLVRTGELSGVLSVRGLKQFLANRGLYGPAVAREIFLQKFEGLSREAVSQAMDENGL